MLFIAGSDGGSGLSTSKSKKKTNTDYSLKKEKQNIKMVPDFLSKSMRFEKAGLELKDTIKWCLLWVLHQ